MLELLVFMVACLPSRQSTAATEASINELVYQVLVVNADSGAEYLVSLNPLPFA